MKQLKRDKSVRPTPTCEQFHAIVESIRQQRLHAECEDSADFVEFLGLARLGNAEAASLTWDDVDCERQKIPVYRHKIDEGFVIPIYPQLRSLLERLYENADRAPDSRVITSRRRLAPRSPQNEQNRGTRTRRPTFGEQTECALRNAKQLLARITREVRPFVPVPAWSHWKFFRLLSEQNGSAIF